MKTVLKYSLLVIVTFICGEIQSQNLKEDLREMGERYQRTEKLNVDMTIEIQFEGSSALKPYKKATLRKDGLQFYYTIDQTETVMTADKLIVVNKKLKEILYRDLEEKEKKVLAKQYYQVGMDSIVTNYDSAVYMGAGPEGKYYQIYSAGRMITLTKLFINEKTGLINKVEYDYNKKISKDVSRVAVVFNYVQISAQEVNLFKEETYLIKSGAQYKSASKYLNYELTKVEDHE